MVVEDLASTGDTVRTEPGVRRGVRRTGNYRRVRMPVYDRFVSALATTPAWASAVSAVDSSAVRALAQHGVTVQRVTATCAVAGETFAADSVVVSATPFQGRREVRVDGRWQRSDIRLEEGTYAVPLAQPLGVVATYLLDPRSDDGLVAWNVGNRVVNGRLALAPTRLGSPAPAVCGLGPA